MSVWNLFAYYLLRQGRHEGLQRQLTMMFLLSPMPRGLRLNVAAVEYHRPLKSPSQSSQRNLHSLKLSHQSQSG
jgi:hypothetical protein